MPRRGEPESRHRDGAPREGHRRQQHDQARPHGRGRHRQRRQGAEGAPRRSPQRPKDPRKRRKAPRPLPGPRRQTEWRGAHHIISNAQIARRRWQDPGAEGGAGGTIAARLAANLSLRLKLPCQICRRIAASDVCPRRRRPPFPFGTIHGRRGPRRHGWRRNIHFLKAQFMLLTLRATDEDRLLCREIFSMCPWG